VLTCILKSEFSFRDASILAAVLENLYKFPPIYRSPGLAQKDIEVTLPLTPQHLVTISHHSYPQYVDITQNALDEFNRRTRFHCAEEFVSKTGETRPYWFDPGRGLKIHGRNLKKASEL
jgi:hypothetical protein